MARYLSNVLDISYIDIRNALSRKPPLILPDGFTLEKAKEIRNNLEEFGSKVLIIEKRNEYSEVFSNRYQKKRRTNKFVFVCIVLLVFFVSILLINRKETVDIGVKAEKNKHKNEVGEPRLEKAGNEPSSPLANEALTALRTLEASYQMGISYREFVEELEKAKSSANMFLQSQEATTRYHVTNSIRNAIIHYKNAAKVWAYSTKYGSGYVSRTRDDLQLYLRLYPDANKPKEIGGAIGNTGESGEVVWIDRLVSIIIGEASKQLTEVARVLAIDSSRS